MKKKKYSNFAFDRVNFMLLAVGVLVIVAGFVLMSGSGSAEGVFDADIFSARRIKVAPVVCLVGFLFMMYGIMHKPATGQIEKEEEEPMATAETEGEA